MTTPSVSKFEEKAKEIVSRQRCRNCKTIGDTCDCEAEGGIRISYPLSGPELISAISSALQEAILEEREACAKIAAGNLMNMKVLPNPATYGDAIIHAGHRIATAIRNRSE